MNVSIGVDVSKEKLDLGWLRDAATGKKKTKVFTNSLPAYKEVKEWLLKQTKAEPRDILITVEPTGVYHEAFIDYMHECGFNIFLANPGKASKFADAIGIFHKTDKSDGVMLAYYGESKPQPMVLWQPDPAEIRELKAMIRRLDALEKDLQREKNRLEASEFNVRSPRVINSIKTMISTLEDQIKKLEANIDDNISQDPELKKNRQLLTSIVGVGPVLSREMVCLFASKCFKNAKQVAAYLGLIPRLRESGKWKGRTMLSKAGPSRIRAKLYMAAVSARTHNPDIRAQKQRLEDAGKATMAAVGAAMRKLVQICFGVIKSQSEYLPQTA